MHLDIFISPNLPQLEIYPLILFSSEKGNLERDMVPKKVSMQAVRMCLNGIVWLRRANSQHQFIWSTVQHHMGHCLYGLLRRTPTDALPVLQILERVSGTEQWS